jgi:hypothetical protein
MRKPNKQFAKLLQVLEYFDGPLTRRTDNKVIAVAIDKKQYQCSFFGAGISRDQWKEYQRAKSIYAACSMSLSRGNGSFSTSVAMWKIESH